jgi:predicted permease
MPIISTISPIFLVILMGWIARRRGFMPESFLGPANRFTFYLAIPAMIFRSIAKSSLKTDFSLGVLTVTLATLAFFFLLAWLTGLLARIERNRIGTFLQSSFHGNLGYIGLAVAFYFLGEKGLTSAAILGGFVMILQNFLAIIALEMHGKPVRESRDFKSMMIRITVNPVILSAISGILFSLSGIKLPEILNRSLDIVGGMALPMSLLLIGGALSFNLMRSRMSAVLLVCFLKLILLPGIGFVFYMLWGLKADAYFPGLILLAAPTATITYVMAREMNGDSDFAVAAISASTLLSAVTFTAWLHIAQGQL